jgi:PmbA protein
MTPQELAHRALGFAPGAAQVTVTHERWVVSRFARSRPTQATDVDDRSVEFLAWHDGHTGRAQTNGESDEELRDAARRAHDAALAAAAAAGPGDHPGLPAPGAGASQHWGFDAETAALDPATAGRALESTFAAAAERDLEAFGIWTAGAVRTAIASTAGIDAVDAVTDAHLKVICRDAAGRTGFASGTAACARDVDAGAVAGHAAAKVVPGEPAELEPGTYPVVLEAPAVAALLGHLAGLAFGGLAYAEGRGALNGRLGTRVAAPAINLADSPRFARTLPRAYDGEGLPKQPLPLIQDGVAHRVVHDTRSAARAGDGVRSTGHALPSDHDYDGPEPTNLVLIGGGAADEAELAAPIERGIYVTRLWYLNAVRERETLLTGTSRDGTFLIEDGRIARPLRDVRFTDSILRILEATEALTMRQQLVAEADFYGRRFATGVVCPSLRAAEFRITGITPA